jgi:hypothetical protein
MDPISRRDGGKILLAGYPGLLVDGREAWASTATRNQQPAASTPQKQSPPSKPPRHCDRVGITGSAAIPHPIGPMPSTTQGEGQVFGPSTVFFRCASG